MKKLICKIFGHKFKRIKTYSFMYYWELVQCERCKEKGILNHKEREFLDWDIGLEYLGEGKPPPCYRHDAPS